MDLQPPLALCLAQNIGTQAGHDDRKRADFREPKSRGGRLISCNTGLRLWLFSIAALIFAMVVVGGSTRLTESGLSITEWHPITGVMPPLSHSAWVAEFDKFKEIPQYKAIFSDLDLNGFKFIFFWEWSHRLLGPAHRPRIRVPLVFFWMREALTPALEVQARRSLWRWAACRAWSAGGW